MRTDLDHLIGLATEELVQATWHAQSVCGLEDSLDELGRVADRLSWLRSQKEPDLIRPAAPLHGPVARFDARNGELDKKNSELDNEVQFLRRRNAGLVERCHELRTSNEALALCGDRLQPGQRMRVKAGARYSGAIGTVERAMWIKLQDGTRRSVDADDLEPA